MVVSKPTVLVAFSGGMDSATLLAKAVKEYGPSKVLAVSAWYGSKHNPHEMAAGSKLCQAMGVERTVADFGRLFTNFKSDLLNSGGAVPEGHYTDRSMSRTVVPCRNLIFASVMAGLADSLGAQSVWLGIHAGDHTVYPDCRQGFARLLDQTVMAATENRVWVHTPFLLIDKADILREGTDLGVDYSITRTCYTADEVACGRCGSCVERLGSFAAVGVEDPLPYKDREAWRTFQPAKV